MRGRPDHASENVPVAAGASSGAPGGGPRGIASHDAPRLREAAHKFCGMLSAFSTVAGNQAADLEDVAASAQLDKAQPIVAQLETIAGELLKRVEGLTIESLRHQAE